MRPPEVEAPVFEGNGSQAQPTAAEYWATRIRASHKSSIEAIVRTGQELAEAKTKLTHGEWGRLTGETTRAPMLPFSSQTAQRLMQIARHPVLANPARWEGLPASWRTLAELARMPVGVLEDHVATGVIHAEMTRATAEDLVAEVRIAQQPPLEERAEPEREPASAPPLEERTEPEREPASAPREASPAQKFAQDALHAAQAAFAEAARRRAGEWEEEMRRRHEQAKRAKEAIHCGLLSKEDFRLIVGCLHPDHQPADRQQKYTKAFQLFSALESRLVAKQAA